MRPLPVLRSQRDFRRLFRQGTRYRARLLTAVVGSSEQARGLRVATVCSKRVGGAVVRNRVRRRLREALRQAAWVEGADVYVAVIAHPVAAEASYQELRTELVRVLGRAGLVVS